MHPKHLSISDFSYVLPEEKIAYAPLVNRDASRLLVFKTHRCSLDQFNNLTHYIPEGSLLAFNDTRVIEARLLFKKQTGAFIEIFCLEPLSAGHDLTRAMQQQHSTRWKCMVGGASKWKKGQLLEKEIIHDGRAINLLARYIEKVEGSFIIEFEWSPSQLCFADILYAAGAIPLPPYIKRATTEDDALRYQTVYANTKGSVAAPTAGLHFTPAVFEKMAVKNIAHAFLTLHVGAGTFQPVKAATMSEHFMHAEFLSVTRELIETLLQKRLNKTIAVGTTSLRTLESIYWLGVKLSLNQDFGDTELMELEQWFPYEHVATIISVEVSLQALLKHLDSKDRSVLYARTSIIIAPGYNFKMIDALITNFHQPQSTLLLLVAALIGDQWKMVYEYALANDLRFLSYGDSSLLWKI